MRIKRTFTIYQRHMRASLFLIVITCTLAACTCGNKKVDTSAEPQPVPVSRALFHNHDSLSYYAAVAYKDDDPKGLYVTGAAARLAQQPGWPDSLHTVSVDEGDIMLLHAAELGYPDAIQLIRCLDYHGCWNHSIPE